MGLTLRLIQVRMVHFKTKQMLAGTGGSAVAQEGGEAHERSHLLALFLLLNACVGGR